MIRDQMRADDDPAVTRADDVSKQASIEKP
jgi:hypothetical protein